MRPIYLLPAGGYEAGRGARFPGSKELEVIQDLKVPRAARAFVQFIKERPGVSLLASLLFTLVLSPGLGQVHSNFTYRAYFYDDDPLMVQLEQFERQFGNDAFLILAIHSPSGIFDADSVELLQEATEAMWKVPEVIRVDSLSNYNWVHAHDDELIIEPFLPDDEPLTPEFLAARKRIALAHEVIPNYLLSADTKTAVLFGALKPNLERPTDAAKVMSVVRPMVERLGRGDHRIYVSGGPAINRGFEEAAQTDVWLNIVVVVTTTIMLGLLLRSLVGIALTLFVVAVTVVAGMSVAGWSGVEISNITIVIPDIFIAIGVADAVHVLSTFFRCREMGLSQKEAAEYSLLKNFMPTLVTSVTTAAGFLTFLSAELRPLVGLGWTAGVGTMFAWVYTYLILGALLFLLPIKRSVLRRERRAVTEARAAWMTDIFIRHRTAILTGFGAVSLACLVLALQNAINSDPFKYFPKGFPVRVANDFIEAEVGGNRGVELAIDSGRPEGVKDPEFLNRVDEFQRWIEGLPKVSRTISIVDILKMTNRSLNGDRAEAYRLPSNERAVAQELFLYQMSLPPGMSLNDRIAVRNDAIRVSVYWTIKTSREATDQIQRIEKKGREMGLNVSATGKNRIWQSMNGYVVRALVSSLTLAILLISTILILFFRSVRVGLVALIPNAVPLLIGGGVLFLIGKSLDIGVSLVMAVCLGIAVDDTIHVLSNFIRLRQEGKTPRAAVIDILATTAPALLTTSAILISAFGTLVVGTFVPTVYFGVMTAIILGVALITDLTFLLAILVGDRQRPA